MGQHRWKSVGEAELSYYWSCERCGGISYYNEPDNRTRAWPRVGRGGPYTCDEIVAFGVLDS